MERQFIKVRTMEIISQTKYENIWSGLVINEEIFDDYRGLYVFGNPSSELEYKDSIDLAIKSFMENHKDKSEENIMKFLTTPIGNKNLKKGYILIQNWIVADNKGIKKVTEYYNPLEITSDVPFTYGMILIAHSYGTKTYELGYFYPNGAKVGISDDHLVFELYS
jgi:hypothetical protein